jgi:hypothetical protein
MLQKSIRVLRFQRTDCSRIRLMLIGGNGMESFLHFGKVISTDSSRFKGPRLGTNGSIVSWRSRPCAIRRRFGINTSFITRSRQRPSQRKQDEMNFIRKMAVTISIMVIIFGALPVFLMGENVYAGSLAKPWNLHLTTLQKFEPQDGKVYTGVFAFSAPQEGWGSTITDWEQQIDPVQISQYENLSGRPTAIASFVWFFDWDFPTDMCKKVDSLGKVPHVGVTSAGVKPSDIVQGKADTKIAEWAAAAKQYGKPVFFRFLAEMNGNWNSYSEAYDPTQTHQMYVEAWRRVVDGFKNAGAGNVIWVWAPTGVDVGNVHWTDYYPGDDYVDWVGISVYSILGNGDPEALIMGIYNDYAAGKPIMIAECGAAGTELDPSNYNPGITYADNPVMWIDRFFDTLETEAPRVKAFVWFNIDRQWDFMIQEAPAKVDTFKKRIENTRYDAALNG